LYEIAYLDRLVYDFRLKIDPTTPAKQFAQLIPDEGKIAEVLKNNYAWKQEKVKWNTALSEAVASPVSRYIYL
jgi:hypothetical protein